MIFWGLLSDSKLQEREHSFLRAQLNIAIGNCKSEYYIKLNFIKKYSKWEKLVVTAIFNNY